MVVTAPQDGWMACGITAEQHLVFCLQSRCVCAIYLVLFSWNAVLAEAGQCLQHLVHKDFVAEALEQKGGRV